MVRKLLIAFAAAAAVTAGSTMTASAMHGWHGMGGGFAARPFGFHEHRMGFHHFPFFPDRFALYGVGYPYTEDCFAPIWTPWGWRWRYMCYRWAGPGPARRGIRKCLVSNPSSAEFALDRAVPACVDAEPSLTVIASAAKQPSVVDLGQPVEAAEGEMGSAQAWPGGRIRWLRLTKSGALGCTELVDTQLKNDIAKELQLQIAHSGFV